MAERGDMIEVLALGWGVLRRRPILAVLLALLGLAAYQAKSGGFSDEPTPAEKALQCASATDELRQDPTSALTRRIVSDCRAAGF